MNAAAASFEASTAPLAHELSVAALEHNGRLMSFNWLLAAYAHRDWLGSWARVLEPRGGVSVRLLRRASAALLERHDLKQRYLKQADKHPWLLLPPASLQSAAQALGVAMLGGWVRNGLEREQVVQQLKVLGPEQRVVAMNHATSLRALPYPSSDGGWPMARLEPSSVFALGVSCMAALLTDHSSGSRERFLMHFAKGLIVPLELNDAQQDEALGLIHGLTRGRRVKP